MKQKRTASEIYRRQNTVIHKALSALGMPYSQNREVWLRLMAEVSGRAVTGLSEMSLQERHDFIREIRKKGVKAFSPGVPRDLREWKKGDPEKVQEFRKDPDPQVRMVFSMWSEMGYPEKTLRGLCWKLFHRDDPSWLDDRQLRHLVNVVKAKAQRRGYGVYYARA